MIQGKRVLAIIPARGGSKGVPRKNIRLMAGKPLIAWTIESAKKSRYIDRLIVSTEDQEIAEIALQWGAEVPFLRPAELARDDTPGVAPVLHALKTIKEDYDVIVLLQPTSPLRKTEDIDNCINYMFECRAERCISICEAVNKPYWMYTLTDAKTIKPFITTEQDYVCRQEMPVVYVPNGSVYVSLVHSLLSAKTFLDSRTRGFVMEKSHSIDIDDEYDFTIADCLLSREIQL